MNYISRVRSSLKKGCDVQLGKLTVICGPNGSGKSTIVQSIELATTGSVSDMEGRDRVKQVAALARLFPGNAPIKVECEADDGTKFLWEMDRKSSTKSPNIVIPITVKFPFREMKDLLSGDGAAISSWIESQVVGASGRQELLRLLPPELREDAEKYIKRQGKSDFLALAQDAKNEAKSLRANATRNEKTIGGLVEGVPMPMLAEERVRFLNRVEELNAAGRDPGMSQTEVDVLKAELSGLIEVYVENQKQQAHQQDAKRQESVGKLVKAKLMHISHLDAFGPAADCWVCGNGTQLNITKHGRMLDEALTRVQPEVQAWSQAESLIAEGKVIEERMQQIADRIKNTPLIQHPASERDELIRILAADEVAARAWHNANAQRAEVEFARKKAETLSKIGDELIKHGKYLLRQRKIEFEERVSAFLPEGEVFGVDLDSARVGLNRSGELHSALSGAEWSRVLLALTSAQASSSTPCILIPDDRAWDRDTLQRVMKSLSKSPFQILLMATVNPGPVEGWTLVETA